MRPTSLDEIRRAVHGRWMTQPAAVPIQITRVSIDSRSAGKGDLFIAIRGANHDGHDFLASAAEAGCVGAVVSADTAVSDEVARGLAGGIIGVADTTTALGELCCRYVEAGVRKELDRSLGVIEQFGMDECSHFNVAAFGADVGLRAVELFQFFARARRQRGDRRCRSVFRPGNLEMLADARAHHRMVGMHMRVSVRTRAKRKPLLERLFDPSFTE